MIKFLNSKRRQKLNINKKGFSLVELLCAVVIIAIMTPVLIEGFTLAARLNYRSSAQMRVDAAANSVYEGLSSVKYDELKHYLADYNGWSALDKTDTNYDYYVEKKYDDLEDCTVKVSVEKYSDTYLVPNLTLVGVSSQYLTLSRELNDYDSIIQSRLLQAIKTDSVVMEKIKTVICSNGVDSDYKDSINLIIEPESISKTDISKHVSINLSTSDEGTHEVLTAEYSLSYKISSLKITYSYTYNDGKKWVGKSGLEYTLDSYTLNAITSASTSIDYVKENEDDSIKEKKLFIYYNPMISEYSDGVPTKTNDKITITSDGGKSISEYNVFFVEQSEVLTMKQENFTSASYTDGNQFVSVGDVKLYSENLYGIPDSVYEESEKVIDMYRLKVEVIYKSKYFADVTGDFAVGDEILQTVSR